jgi:hypothetical protein
MGRADDEADPSASGVAGHRGKHPQAELVVGSDVGEIEYDRGGSPSQGGVHGFA